MKITFGETESTRRCGSCTLCCKLVPVKEIDKPANTRCNHQRVGKGCTIFKDRPFSCRMWNCVWLTGEPEAMNLSRPDRAHYVIDIQPDYVTLQYTNAPDLQVPVIQVWLDPDHPDAHRDPALRAYIEFVGKAHGAMAIVRTSSTDGFVICPPNLAADGKWHEEKSDNRGKDHTFAEVMDVLNAL